MTHGELLDFNARVSLVASPDVQAAANRVLELYDDFMLVLASLPARSLGQLRHSP